MNFGSWNINGVLTFPISQKTRLSRQQGQVSRDASTLDVHFFLCLHLGIWKCSEEIQLHHLCVQVLSKLCLNPEWETWSLVSAPRIIYLFFNPVTACDKIYRVLGTDTGTQMFSARGELSSLDYKPKLPLACSLLNPMPLALKAAHLYSLNRSGRQDVPSFPHLVVPDSQSTLLGTVDVDLNHSRLRRA